MNTTIDIDSNPELTDTTPVVTEAPLEPQTILNLDDTLVKQFDAMRLRQALQSLPNVSIEKPI